MTKYKERAILYNIIILSGSYAKFATMWCQHNMYSGTCHGANIIGYNREVAALRGYNVTLEFCHL